MPRVLVTSLGLEKKASTRFCRIRLFKDFLFATARSSIDLDSKIQPIPTTGLHACWPKWNLYSAFYTAFSIFCQLLNIARHAPQIHHINHSHLFEFLYMVSLPKPFLQREGGRREWLIPNTKSQLFFSENVSYKNVKSYSFM